MNSSIITNNSINHKSFQINNIYKVFEINNVISYSYINHNSWHISYNSQIKNVKHYYFIIDTEQDEAFAHWIYESALYLPCFIELKKTYPTLKLILKSKRTFKTLFCTYLGIEPSYNLEQDNICFFPSPISGLCDKTITEEWKQQVCKFKDYFIGEEEIIYENVIMPRQSKENFKNNDRKYNFLPLINDISNKIILNTDEITDLKDQIKVIRSAKNIFITEGSPFLVNGLFCNKKTIVVVDSRVTIGHELIFPKIDYIIHLNKSSNEVLYKTTEEIINQ